MPGASLTLAGNFDADGDVDGTDFLAWQRGLGVDYNETDLSDWQNKFGTTTGVALKSIPEPNAFSLLTIGLVNLSGLRLRITIFKFISEGENL